MLYKCERAEKMIVSGNTKKQRKNPNDPGSFIGTVAVTDNGEAAKVHSFLDENKIADDLHEISGFRTDYQFITKS